MSKTTTGCAGTCAGHDLLLLTENPWRRLWKKSCTNQQRSRAHRVRGPQGCGQVCEQRDWPRKRDPRKGRRPKERHQGPRERHPQGEHWAAQGQTQKAQGPWEELLGEKRWAAQGQTQQAQRPWEELLGEKRWAAQGRTQRLFQVQNALQSACRTFHSSASGSRQRGNCRVPAWPAHTAGTAAPLAAGRSAPQ